MIASLRGQVLSTALDHIVIECAGVGYRVQTTPVAAAGMARGADASVLVTMVVREDSMTLYGFDDPEDQELFLLLQTVTGVGPRLAMAAIAVLEPDEMKRALSTGDIKTLCLIPGIGKRVAERLIVELRDKVSVLPSARAPAAITSTSAVADQLRDALEGLGFTPKQLEPVVQSVVAQDDSRTTSELLREALRRLGKS